MPEVEDPDDDDSLDGAEDETPIAQTAVLDPNKTADLARQELSLADEKLITVYGDMVHCNDRRDLYVGVEGMHRCRCYMTKL